MIQQQIVLKRPRPKSRSIKIKENQNLSDYQSSGNWGPLNKFDGLTLKYQLLEPISSRYMHKIAYRIGTSAFAHSQDRFPDKILICLYLESFDHQDLSLFAKQIKKQFEESFEEIFWNQKKSSIKIPTLDICFSIIAP